MSHHFITAKFPDRIAITSGHQSLESANDSIRRAVSTRKRRPQDIAEWARLATSEETATAKSNAHPIAKSAMGW